METMKLFTLKDLLTIVATKKETFSDKDVEAFLKEFFATLAELLSKNGQVEIRDFGMFTFSQIPERRIADAVSDGETKTFYQIGFVPDGTLRNFVNSSFSHFEPTLLNEGVAFSDIPEIIEGKDESTHDLSSNLIVKITDAKESEISPKKDSDDETETKLERIPAAETTSDFRPPAVSGTLPSSQVRQRKKPSVIWIPVLGGIAVALASLFFFREWQIGKAGTVITAESLSNAVKDNTAIVEKDTVVEAEPVITQPEREPEKIILETGKTLRLLALDAFGNREFWIYIYLKNKHKIKNPNVVPVGTELLIPDASEYGINASDTQSVTKAKILGDELLSQF